MHRSSGFHAFDSPFERIFHRRELEICPSTCAIRIDGTHAEGVVGDGCQIVEEMIQSADGGINLTLMFHFVVVGIFYSIPRRLERVSLYLALLLVELRSSKFAVVHEKAIGGLKLKTFHRNTHRVFSDIGGSKVHEYLRILDDFAHTLFSSAHPAVEIRLRIVEPHVGALFKLLACAHLCEFHLSITHRGSEFLRSLRYIDAQFRLL